MTHAKTPASGLIIDDFLATARQLSEHPALVSPVASVSYRQLAGAVATASAELERKGAERGTLVRLHGPVGAPLIAYTLGAWQCGAVVWLDAAPDLRSGEEPSAEASLLSVTVGHDGEDVDIQTLHELPSALAAAARQIPLHRAELIESGGGYLVRTSGSTGRQKVILGDLRALSSFVAWQRTEFDFSPDDRVAALTGVNFDVVYRDLFTTLTSGSTLLCAPPNLAPSRILSWLRDSDASVLHVVPSLARYWLAASRRNGNGLTETPELRITFFAGEPLDAQLAHEWRSRTGSAQEVVNLYGPSETTLAKFSYRVPQTLRSGAIPVGRPLPGTTVTITATDTGGSLPRGSVGEVVITTNQGSFGYLGDPVPEWADKFRRDGDLVTFQTGDLGSVRSEGLVLLGRLDSRLKINGVWVNCHEVETALRTHPAVKDAAVIGERVGPGIRLSAFVVLGEQIELHALRSHVLQRLGRPSVPAIITQTEQLPRLATGKVDRTSLRRLLNVSHGDSESVSLEPSRITLDDLVEHIAKSVQALLGTAVATDGDLIDSGFDVTAAAQLCAVLEEELMVACAPEDVLAHPVPEQLGSLLLARIHRATEK
ncbi:AMP-binding protein [Streptomyces sp. SP17KL33]|uniref:AMP-binding protein n=1 Tax=Streptomyces sp. SP17KL33 TaxID=3002534 RepID=UPI002E7A5854|nr:AMP-binding protein [Streptomyces sp. SP17KL33]MEE1831707.1 AMP-binding protein [Streptomyces sp. SP17KL33]